MSDRLGSSWPRLAVWCVGLGVAFCVRPALADAETWFASPAAGGNVRPTAVSADGSTVVGVHVTPAGSEAFSWTKAGGLQLLGDLSGGTLGSGAYGVNADGSVIVGHGNGAAGMEPVRWTTGGGIQSLGTLSTFGGNFASGVSADGSTIVGLSGDKAFRWRQDTGMQAIPDLPGSGVWNIANGIDHSGSTIVGYGLPGAWEAFRYVDGDLQGLGQAPGGQNSYANAVSGDGSTIVGRADVAGGEQAFCWTSKKGMTLIPDMDVAYGASYDGSIIIGQKNFSGFDVPMIHVDGETHNLITYVNETFGLDVNEFQFEQVRGVSADGNVFTGWTTSSLDGSEVAWVIAVPEPAHAGLLATAASLLCPARRRQSAR